MTLLDDRMEPMFACLVLLLGIVALGALGARGMRASRFLDIQPRFRAMLQAAGLSRVEDFLVLPGEIVCGHRNRHVVRTTVGSGFDKRLVYLKREQRILWRDYLHNAWHGFGMVSRSDREAQMLRALRQAGIASPEFMASGEDGQGRAFLMVQSLPNTRELGDLLGDRTAMCPDERSALARDLGRTIARMHAAGFHHADLHAKHVLIGLGEAGIHFIDWQRSRCFRPLSWLQRLHDLASLEATLADELASRRERLLCLRSYLRASPDVVHGFHQAKGPTTQSALARFLARRRDRRLGHPAARSRKPLLAWAVALIHAQAKRLLGKRYIRELRQSRLAVGTQALVWLDEAELCVTSEFHADLDGQLPDWLKPASWSKSSESGILRRQIRLAGERRAEMVQRQEVHFLPWLWSCLRGRPHTSPEARQAVALFRLQRYGIVTPKLLAIGERHPRPWRTESLLLTETQEVYPDLVDWLEHSSRQERFTIEKKRFRHVLRETGRLLQTLHETGCYIGLIETPTSVAEPAVLPLKVSVRSDGELEVVLSSVTGLRTRRRPRLGDARRDLADARRAVPRDLLRRTDELRVLLSYLGLFHLTPAAKRFLRSIPQAS